MRILIEEYQMMSLSDSDANPLWAQSSHNNSLESHWRKTGLTLEEHWGIILAKKMNFVKKSSTFTFRGKSPVFIEVSEGEGCWKNLHPTFTLDSTWLQIVLTILSRIKGDGGEGWVKVSRATFTFRNPYKHWEFIAIGEGWRIIHKSVSIQHTECSIFPICE